ncbi:MAG TPA: hypothetical protein PLA52_05370 [Candidatus Omnitrophota bacterium]|nr:hypothetical protein [Candidatus Omnitrophota bacterium]
MRYALLFLLSVVMATNTASAETGMVAEGYSKVSKAAIDFSDGEYSVKVDGRTGMPDGTRIYVFLKKGEYPLSCKIARAAEGKFSTELGPFRAKLPIGIYTVEASLKASETPGTKDVYRLVAGRPEDAAKEEESNMAALSAGFASAGSLFDELEQMHAQYKENFDPAEWKRWSEGWAARLRREQQSADNGIKPLLAGDYSGPGQALSQLIRDLDQLGRVYSSELDGGGIKDAYPYAFRDPAQLKAVINESLKNSKKVVLTNCGLNGI